MLSSMHIDVAMGSIPENSEITIIIECALVLWPDGLASTADPQISQHPGET